MTLVNADGVYKALDDSYRSAGMPKKVYLKFKRWLKKNEIKSEPSLVAIDRVETIDTRSLAEWNYSENTGRFMCSNCLHPVLLNGTREYEFSNYCPFCGSVMINKDVYV